MEKIYKNVSWDATKISYGFKYLFFISCMFMAGGVWGQVSNYTFSQSNGTYTAISSPTILGSGSSLDDNTYSIAAGSLSGFTFNFSGVNYTAFTVSANGFIGLGSSLMGSSIYTPLSSSSGGNAFISAYADDLGGLNTNTQIAWKLEGVAPNRELVIEWKNIRNYSRTGADLSFQIRLLETSNIVKFVYGTMTYTSTTPDAVQVGLKSSTTTGHFINRTTTSNWNSTTAGTLNSATCRVLNTVTMPSSGLTFTWTPPSPCAAPTSLAASGSSSSQTNTTISGSFTAAPTAPTGYIVVRSTSPTQPTSLALGTALPAVGNTTAFGAGTIVEYVSTSVGNWVSSGLTAGTTYYYYIFSYNNASCTGGPAYSTSATTFSQSTASCTGAALASLSYTTSTASYCTGNAITANTATLGTTNGVPTYAISPALPSGLSLNTATGNITGTPTTAQSANSFIVTADNGCTSTTANISIEVLASPAAPASSASSGVSYSGFTANWTTNGAASYLLDVATDASFTNLVSGYNTLNVGNVGTYNVTGLGAGIMYYYRVRAVNGSCISANSTSQSLTTTAISSITTGSWNATTTWNSGSVPTCTDNVTIANTHNVTLNSSGNVSRNLTIASGGTLTVASGDLTVGCTLNNTPLTNNGTLTVSGGTLNVNGNLNNVNASFFNQSGGTINVDGNAGGVIANSVPSGTNIFGFGTSGTGATLNLTGGTIVIVDPHVASSSAGGTSNGHSFTYWGSGYRAGINHTIQIGNGVSIDPGGNTSGYQFNTWPGTGYFISGNLVIDVPSGTNRFVTGSYSIGIERNLTVSNGELRLPTPTKIGGNISVNSNGILTSTGTTELALWGSDLTSSSSSAASTNAQTIGGSGTFRNATASPSASLTSLTVNNSNATGVTLNVPLSISGTLTMTAGKINTTSTNLLTLGTSTAAGTLSYTAGQIVGPFERTFAASRTTSGTYTVATLFPVGDGTNYIPIHIDPTTTSSGAVIFRGQAFNTNSGTGGSGVATTLSNDRWEAIITSGSANLTNCFIGLNDAQIAAGNIIAQSATANGTYNVISPASTAVAGTSIRTAAAIAAADYTGYFTYAAPGPRITSFTPTTACPNAATTITITGTNLGSATSVTLNGEACTIVTNTATQIIATTDASPQAGNIVVTTAANTDTSTSAMSLFTLPTVTASSNPASNTVCSGTSVTLNGGGASSYSWDNSVTDNTAFTPISSTNYTVTGTDANGCKNTASISITVNQIVTITTQPSNQVVLPNANATFTVAATGTGLTYQWEESTDNGNTWNPITNGGVYSGATTNSLLLTSVNSSYNSYQYRVVINGTAPCNAETSNAATLTLSNTAITAHPQNETICSSSGTANFSITTSGTTPFYQWQISLNGVSWSDITGENNPTLSLSGITISNSLEQYRCQLDFGAINSNAAILTVYDPPVIGTQPSNLTVCSNATTGSFSISASGSNLTYQWQVSTDAGSSWNNVSGSNVSGTTSDILTFSSYTNAMNGNQYRVVVSGSSPCTSVTSNAVTLNVTGISFSASASTVCQNSPVTFTVTPNTGSPTLSYSWTSTIGSGATNAVTANPASITPTESGSYTYTLITTDGSCTISNTAAVTVNPIPTITSATATPATVCSGNSIGLSANSTLITNGNASIGTGALTGSSVAQSIFPGAWGGAKTQYLIRASELSAAGINPGNFTSIAFEPTTSGQTYQGFFVYINSTSSNVLSTTYESLGTQVYAGTLTDNGYTPTAGSINTLSFGTGSGSSSSFNWNGTSNIIVTFSWSRVPSASTSIASSMKYDAVSYNCANYTQRDNSTPAIVLALTTGLNSTSRPKFTFGGQVSTNQTSNFIWSWNSSPALSAAAGSTTETNNAASATTKTYIVTATNATTGCSNTATTSAVTINPATIAPTATNSSQCGSATPTCSVSGTGTAGNTFRWYAVATGGTAIAGQTAATLSSYPVSTSSSFYVSESNGTCESPRAQLDVTVSTPPSITVAATLNPVCSGSATSLSASSANTGYTYAWSNSLGSGANVSASPTANTTYTVTATDNSGGTNNGCATTGSILVTTNPIPSALTLSPSTTTSVCGGSVQTISLTSGGNGATSSSSTVTNSTGTISLAIPDNSSTGVSSSLLVSTIPSSATITQVDVTFSLNHAWLSDAELVLTAPNGKVIALAADQGPSSTGSYTNCTITSNISGTSLSTTSTPITGTFKANATVASSLKGAFGTNLTQNFSDLFSTPNGSWILSAYDDGSGDLGTLTSYSITITYSVPNIIWSPTTDLYTDAAATSAYTGTAATTLYAKPTANRTYTATSTIVSTGCANTKTVQLNNRTPANNVVLVSSSKTGAVEQCTDANGWTYYGTAANPDEWLFGIHKNGNTFTATVDINVDPANKFRESASSNGANQEHASYIMSRYWNATLSSGSIASNSSVKVRFFIDTQDITDLLDERDDDYDVLKNTTNTNTFAVKSGFEWFKTVASTYSPTNWNGNTHSGTIVKLTEDAVATLNGQTYVELSGITSFSGGSGGAAFGPTSNGLFNNGGVVGLPVTWHKVDVQTLENGNEVVWSTSSEQNTSHFEVEYSDDAVQFYKVSENIPAAGNSSTTQYYKFLHESEMKPWLYYRVKQVDLDGKVDYSKIVIAKRSSKQPDFKVAIYPIPLMEGDLTLDIHSIAQTEIQIRVIDLLGKEVYREKVPSKGYRTQHQLQLNHLPKGQYQIQIDNSIFSHQQRLVLMK